MFLIAGLGNPGGQYEETRHNAGFFVVDEIAKRHNVEINKIKRKSLFAKCQIYGHDVLLIKPQTYMNLSGSPVQEFASFYNIQINNIIIIHDDIDLPFGEVRIKIGGGHGGHNGIRNTIEILGEKNFIRVKAGIGRPSHPNFPVEKYVLSKFTPEEKKHLENFIILLMQATEAIIINGLTEAMNEYNGKNVIKS